ncbi:MAG: histidine kinase dimerization/phosphoacceptor domain -containing protein [Saprospiraceae bacterium]
MKKCLFYLLCALCFLTKISAQHQAYEDSLLQIISKDLDQNLNTDLAQDTRIEEKFLLGEYLVQRHPEQAALYADELVSLLANVSDSATWVRLNYIYAASHRWQGNYKTALAYYQTNYDYFKQNKELLELAFCSKKIGLINLFLGNNVLSQEYLLECAEIYQDIGTAKQIASINNSLASFYLNIDQMEKGLARFQQVLEQFTILNDSSGLASANANLGYVYLELGEYEKAESHLLAQKGYNEVFPTLREMGFHYDFMGLLRQKQNRLPEALVEHEKALSIREKLSSTYNLCESKLNMGSVLIKLGQYTEAIKHLKAVLSFEEHQSLNQEQLANSLLSEAYEKRKDHLNALKHYKAYSLIKDSIYNKESIQVIAEKDARYKKQEQDAEIALLNKENVITAERLKNSRLIIIGGSIALLCFGFLCFWIYRMYQKIKGQNEIIHNALNDKNLLIQEIHHRVKNNLQVISSLLSLQSNFIKDENAKKAITDGRNRIKSMAILHQNLYREDNITGVNIKNYFSNLVKEIFNSYQLNKRDIELQLDIEDIVLDVDTVVPIGLITNELITNALKYAFVEQTTQAIIKVVLKEKEDNYSLVVSDNGIGIDDDILERDPNESFGQLMIHAFIAKLKAQMNFDNKNGTKVLITIPKPKGIVA